MVMTMAASVVTAGIRAVLCAGILHICEALIFTTAGLSVELDLLVTIPSQTELKHKDAGGPVHVGMWRKAAERQCSFRVYDFNYRLSCFCKAEAMLY